MTHKPRLPHIQSPGLPHPRLVHPQLQSLREMYFGSRHVDNRALLTRLRESKKPGKYVTASDIQRAVYRGTHRAANRRMGNWNV